MIEFRKQLQSKLLEFMEEWTTDVDPKVATFDKRLRDVPLEQTPFLVVNVRRGTHDDSEIGVEHDLVTWEVHIYYLDIDSDYDAGETKRDNILSRVEKNLEENRRLENFEVVAAGVREYVYDLKISDVLWDSSGQEEYYSFTGEMELIVYSARSK